MTTRVDFLPILLLTLFIISCNRVTPADFWSGFQKDQIIKNISDQGAYGGHRAMSWKTERPNVFNSKTVIAFAEKSGWQFIDSFKFKPEQMRSWHNSNGLIFPFSYRGFSDSIKASDIAEFFPRWIDSELIVFTFKTGWVAIEPGNAQETEKNGFVIINKEGTEMSIYHLWGE